MALTWASVVAIAPELAGLPVESQAAIVGYVEAMLSPEEWGGRLGMAQVYLAAHYGTLTKNGGNGAAGPVVSESLGSASRSYAAFSPMGSDPLLDTTPYGKTYRSLLGSTIVSAMVV